MRHSEGERGLRYVWVVVRWTSSSDQEVLCSTHSRAHVQAVVEAKEAEGETRSKRQKTIEESFEDAAANDEE